MSEEESMADAFDLDRFIALVLAAGQPAEKPPLRERQRGEAKGILASCTSTTPRPVVAWAAGVMEAGHAMHFVRPLTARSFAVECSGGSLDGGRWYRADRKGLEVTEGLSSTRVARVTWEHVAELFRPDTIPFRLGVELAEAMAERQRRTPVWKPGASMHPTPERELEQAAWNEIEQHCYDLGAQVWELVRPPHDAPARPVSSHPPQRVSIPVGFLLVGVWARFNGMMRDGTLVSLSGAVIAGPDDVVVGGEPKVKVLVRTYRDGEADRMVYLPPDGTVDLVDDADDVTAQVAHALAPVFPPTADWVEVWRRVPSRRRGREDGWRLEVREWVGAEELAVLERGGDPDVRLSSVRHGHVPVPEKGITG